MDSDSTNLLVLGNTLFGSGKFEEAAKCYMKYLQQNPGDLTALFHLGQALFQADNLDEAEKCFRHLVAVIPGNSASLWLLARTLMKKGSLEEGARFYEKVAELVPQNAAVAFEFGVLYTNQGRYEKAISKFKQALQWQPDFAQAEQYLRHTESIRKSLCQHAANAFLLLQGGQYEQAEQVYRSILGDHPISALASYFLGHDDDATDALQFAHALRYYWTDQLPQADSLCRQALKKNTENGWAYVILSLIAQRVGRTDLTIEYFAKAMANSQPSRPSKSGQPKFLLIKAWGSGFWSDFEHVLGQILWAEVLEREPIVYWGPESLYSNGDEEEIFTKFFQPISKYSISDVLKEGLDYYPDIWKRDNLLHYDRQAKLSRYRSESWGVDFLGRSEDVIVSDIHIFVDVLLPWIPRQHCQHDCASIDIYRYIINKYIKLQPYLATRIQEFYEQHMRGHNLIAVHVRGGDRTESVIKLRENNEEYFRAIDQICSVYPAMQLFLLTDSEFILNEFKQVYGDRVLYTECTRAVGSYGVHYLARNENDKQAMAMETVVDVYLAAKCDYFIGCNSNVSTMIARLKCWEKNTIFIFGHLPSTRL
ncbi:hypothetical protein AXX12_01200 [Anaerosporomusa subterranea]|uniref:Tetratricopeptide repeat protein n=1 Tax=Anaerosporomusa subterranea TaxID=1794912 RepID=A0A154BWM3_ANASB|nr:tetratricopeptide repeat protein [Anaerosporomusa subterranea]KYZ78190.1 hypothetical protein AXX12_01200 [Anaerosporomusa subterranea]